MEAKRSGKASKHITEASAAAQRAKLDNQAEDRLRATTQTTKTRKTRGKKEQRDLLTRRRANTTIEQTIADYLADHEGGNSSPKTLEWYAISVLATLRDFLQHSPIRQAPRSAAGR